MPDYSDTHCHFQFDQYDRDREEVYNRAVQAGVGLIVTVGTAGIDSQKAVDFANNHDGVWATVGMHPHDCKNFDRDKQQVTGLVKAPKVVAVGECGLDYFREHSKLEQEKALRWQIELALANNLPLVFHIRDAWDDFWRITGDYIITGAVAHCFAAGPAELSVILRRGWYVGVNGIVTFTKDTSQLAAFKTIPLNKLLIETDAPFLTPAPLRGKVNESNNVVVIAEFLSKLRGEPLDLLVNTTTQNAKQLFKI
jgi:TatD DNase family protein